MNSHLNSEQLECMLHGEPSQEASRHLSGCVQCSDELASLRQVFGNFREAATAAADHHRRAASPAVSHRVPRLAWGFAVAALFVSVATPLAMQHRNVAPVVLHRPVARAAETMSDEALLSDVQNDLSSSVPESLLPLSGTSTSVTESTNVQRKD
jgi:hypothetical protein